MPLYTFYPCRADGTSGTFLTSVLHDDTASKSRAMSVLREHPSASHVAIWCGERKVGIRERVHADLMAVLGRSAA